MLQKKPLIKALTALGINLALLITVVQCKEKKGDLEVLFLKNEDQYSFLMETPSTITYSTPSSMELISRTEGNKNNIIFPDKLKEFRPYKFALEEKNYDNIYVSNVLGETNFNNSHLFEYDVQISKSGNIKSNIYYPYDLRGSYEFKIDNEATRIFRQLLYKISSDKDKSKKVLPDSKLNNVIVLEDDGRRNEVFTSENNAQNNLEYSLLLAWINKLLLENINKANKINHLDIPSIQYVERLDIPPDIK
ncbi:hypothetical protein J2786_003618 [Chryseobacterium vietnamense]|uniref:Uncharacterized protein n=1 Tax=Chryseobacterium vietnamense TaxID=866785 RepID=A0ACC6JCB5_9FLAO|nr:hypothetical protein [Chryseobacterium vietnamense]MDR6460484.1 hypothetical protein [Chryseobacterium vietnamense]